MLQRRSWPPSAGSGRRVARVENALAIRDRELGVGDDCSETGSELSQWPRQEVKMVDVKVIFVLCHIIRRSLDMLAGLQKPTLGTIKIFLRR